MKIGIDIRCLADGRTSGVEEYTQEILKNLFALDSNNTYILFLNAFSSVKADLSWVDQFPNVTIKRLRIPNKLLNFSLWYFRFPQLDRLIGGVDVFFAPNISFLAVSHKTKLVLTIHDLSFELYAHTFSRKMRWWHTFVAPHNLCKRASRIVAVSESTKKDLMAHYGLSQEKISVIPSGVRECYAVMDRNDPTLLAVKDKYDLPYRFILFLGTWEPRKNIESIISGYTAYRKATDKQGVVYKLVLAGHPGWGSKEVEHALAKSPYREDIITLGYIDDKDKPALYNLASVFVYPSFYEGFGFPVLEAMRCGTPVITSHTSSLVEVTEGHAILIDPHKPHELYIALRELLSDKTLYRILSDAGKRKSYEYRWHLASSRLLEVFREVLGNTIR